MADRHTEGMEKAAVAIFDRRHPAPHFRYNRHADRWAADYAHAAVAAYLDHVRPEVKTPEQLEALPLGTIIVNRVGNAWEKGGRNWYHAGATGGQKRVPYLPARVIHWGVR